MKDSIVLITGASSGLGLETARELAAQGARIVMVCRDLTRGQAAQRQIESAARGGASPDLYFADLSSQASVHALSRKLHTDLPRIDVLINNAGGIFDRRELTDEDMERTLATNYLAPFLLTHLVLDLLLAAPAGRIVNIVSVLHNAGPDVLENLHGEKSYSFMGAYKISKFALISFTYELARRLRETAVTVNCVEPGPTKTRFGDNMTGLPRLFPLIMKKLPLFRPVRVGARSPVYVASSPELQNITGTYFENGRPARSRPITHDRDIALRLWRLSAELTELDIHDRLPAPRAPADRSLVTLPSAQTT